MSIASNYAKKLCLLSNNPLGAKYSARELNLMASMVPFSEAYLELKGYPVPNCYVVGADRSLSEHMRHNVFNVIADMSHNIVSGAPCLMPKNILERLFFWREYRTLLEFLHTQGLYSVTYFRNAPFEMPTYGTVYLCEVRLLFDEDQYVQ